MRSLSKVWFSIKGNILPLNVKIFLEEIFINYFIIYFSRFVLGKILHFLFLVRDDCVIFISSWSYFVLLLTGRSPQGFLSRVVSALPLDGTTVLQNSIVFLFSPLLQIPSSHFSQQSIFLSIETPLYCLPQVLFVCEVLGNDTATLSTCRLKQE